MNNVEEIAAKDEKISLIFENERAAGILREMMLCCSGFIFVEIKKADAWSWKTGAHKISRKKLNEKSNRMLPISCGARTRNMLAESFGKMPSSSSVRVENDPFFMRTGKDEEV